MFRKRVKSGAKNMNWDAHDQDDSDNEMFQMSSSRMTDDPARVRLLSVSDEDTQPAGHEAEDLPRLSFRRTNVLFTHKEEERKFKLALISILVAGITLIIIINIGLGIGLKNMSGQSSPPPASCTQDNNHAENTKYCDKSFPWQKYRLPEHVVPQQYSIFLHPNTTTSDYYGSVDIVISTNKSTNTIILHSQDQELSNVAVYQGIGIESKDRSPAHKLKQTGTFLRCIENDFVAIQLADLIVPNKMYTIHIDFSGNLTNSLMGFYLSKYKTESGENKTIATTQFESTSARAAFPCFDEPSYKANFSLTMIREPDQVALFNTPVKKTVDFQNNLKQDNFETTVVMSTYLVAFIVCDFSNISKVIPMKNGQIRVSVYAPKEKIDKASFALDVACKTLTLYEEIFKVPYPLSKLDLISIPDFQAGAMENWGLVTYRETLILFDPETSSTEDQERVATVIAHELAHQWFGNLVTMEWWNDLWLNEGFASYVEFLGVSKIFPEWQIMEEFNTQQTISAMKMDESSFTHPISVPVENSVQINEVFDAISYSKGACIISMLLSYLGEDVFFNGIGDYLKTYAYGNTVNQNLINAVAYQAKEKEKKDNIIKMMHSWTNLPGFPVITVSRDKNQITVSQSRYLVSLPQESSDHCPVVKFNPVWEIPLSYITSESIKVPQWKFIDKRKTIFSISGNPSWIKFNFNRGGYYLINYSSELLSSLTDQIKKNHKIFSKSDRSGILVDVIKSAKTGYTHYEKVFDLLSYLQNEEDYEPINTAMIFLIDVEKKFSMQFDSNAHNNIKLFIQKLVTNLYKKFDWQNDKEEKELSHSEKKLRKLVITAMCRTEHQHCTETALKKYKAWKYNNTAVALDYKKIVYPIGIKLGSKEDWQHMWKVYSTDLTLDALEKKKLLMALCKTSDETKISFLLDEAMKDEAIRNQDIASVVAYLASNRFGSYIVWKFVRNKWKEILKVHSLGSFSARYIIEALLDKFTDESEMAGAREFFMANNITDVRFVKRALDSANTNIHWIKTYQPVIVQWLKNNVL